MATTVPAPADTLTLALDAAGCPLPDCLTNHTDGDTGHYTPATHAGPVTVSLDLDDDGTASITLTQGGHTERLDLDETGALMAALAAHHARMTALHTELTAHRTTR